MGADRHQVHGTRMEKRKSCVYMPAREQTGLAAPMDMQAAYAWAQCACSTAVSDSLSCALNGLPYDTLRVPIRYLPFQCTHVATWQVRAALAWGLCVWTSIRSIHAASLTVYPSFPEWRSLGYLKLTPARDLQELFVTSARPGRTAAETDPAERDRQDAAPAAQNPGASHSSASLSAESASCRRPRLR
jgi:hypothetical protein